MSPVELAIILTAYAKINKIIETQRQLLKTQQAVEKVNQTAQKAQGAFSKISNTIKKAFDTEVIDKFSEKLEKIATVSGAVGASITATLSGMVSKFMEQEQAKVQMEVAFMEKGGKISPELEKIKKLATKLGNTLPGTTADFYRLAQALREQGLSAQTILKGALEASAYLGALFRVDYAYAGEMVAKFQEAFRVPEEQLVKFVDLVQRTKYAFGLNLEDIYYSVKYFAGQLNTLGIMGMESAKKIMAWMGILASTGIEGSTAGTAIANALEALTKLKEPPKEVARILDAYGIQLKVFDETGKFLGLDVFFKEIQKLRVLSQEERLKVLQKLFGEEGARAISALLKKPKALEEAIQKMERQASLQKRIDKLLNSFSAKWEAFTGNLENLMAQLASFLIPTLKTVIIHLTNFTEKLSAFIEEHKTLASVIMHIIAVAGAFFSILSMLTLGVYISTKAWQWYIYSLVLLRRAFISTSIVARIFSASLLTNPLSWIAFALASAGLLIYKNWEKVKAFFSGFFKGLANAVSPIINAFAPLIHVFNLLWKAVSFLFNTIAKVFSLFFQSSTPISKTTQNFQQLASVGEKVGYVIGTVLTLPLKILIFPIKLLANAVNWLSANWKKALTLFLWTNPITAPIMAFKKVIDFLKSINLFEIGRNIIESLKNGIMSVVKAPVEAVKNVGAKIINGVKNLFRIRSPSRVFMEIGQFLNLGLFEGIKTSVGVLNRASQIFKAILPENLKFTPQLIPINNVLRSLSIPLMTSVAVAQSAISLPVKTEKPISKTVNQHINVYITVYDKNPRETAKLIEKEIRKALRELQRRVELSYEND